MISTVQFIYAEPLEASTADKMVEQFDKSR
jgi:hypothetical protein